jgi:hypothetical protein
MFRPSTPVKANDQDQGTVPRAEDIASSAPPRHRISINNQHRWENVTTEYSGNHSEVPLGAECSIVPEPRGVVTTSDLGYSDSVDNIPCLDHDWPPELDSRSDCGRCGLTYEDWSI